MSSIVIPAHNEAKVIERCLSSILADAELGEFEVVVVCNGCSDNTVEVAGAMGSDVRVVELAEASKVAALNRGDALATRFPRHFIDADVEVRAPDIRRVSAALSSGSALVAAPGVAVDGSEASWAVRAFSDIWLRLRCATGDLYGAGFYGMSEEVRRRFRQFPDLVADDLWAQQLVAPGQRMVVQEAISTIRPPRTLSAQVRVRARHLAGNRVLREDMEGRPVEDRRQRSELVKLLRFPRLWPELAIHVGVNLVARVATYRPRQERAQSWARDDTSRTPVTPRE